MDIVTLTRNDVAFNESMRVPKVQTIWLIPNKAVKSKFIVPVYISVHVPGKSGNYKPWVYFSPLWVCINVEKNAASVLHLPHCSDCTLWTLRGGCSASLHFSTHLAYTVIPNTYQTYSASKQSFQIQHHRPTSHCLANPCKIIVICRTNTAKFMSESHDILRNLYIQCGFMCICVYINASTDGCMCIQSQGIHGRT